MSRTRHSTGRHRRKKHEEHANHEAWAIPYGDLVTLLLAFFVVMYAISSVNAGKYRVLSDSLFAAFRGTPRTMQPIQIGEKQQGNGADMNSTTVQQAMLEGRAQSRLSPIPVSAKSSGSGQQTGQLPAQAAAAAAALSHLADEVAHAMDQLVQKDMVTIRRTDFWIEVEMRSDILFPSGSARLADSAVDVIQRLGDVLAPFPNPIRVEGHTDNKPIKTAVFYSNWELSAARAGSVVRVLASHGVAPERLAVIGYGEQRPSKPNDTAEGRNANRRVVVVILSTELMRQGPNADGSSPLPTPDNNGLNSVPTETPPPNTAEAPDAAGPAADQRQAVQPGAALAPASQQPPAAALAPASQPPTRAAPTAIGDSPADQQSGAPAISHPAPTDAFTAQPVTTSASASQPAPTT